MSETDIQEGSLQCANYGLNEEETTLSGCTAVAFQWVPSWVTLRTLVKRRGKK